MDLCFQFIAEGENSKAKADKVLANYEILSASKRITTLELKELNERKRAEHAQKMYDQTRNSLRQVEERNTELESKIAEVWLFWKTADNYSVQHFQFPVVQNMFDKDSRSHFTVKAEVISILQMQKTYVRRISWNCIIVLMFFQLLT